MSSRIYPVVVAVWVVAAVVAVGYTLARRTVEPEMAQDALPVLPVGTRASASYETEDTLPSALAALATAPVQGNWTGPGGRPFQVVVRSRRASADYRYRQIGTQVFYLPLRLDSTGVSQDPCASCHTSQGIVDGRRGSDVRGVHQNIQPVHPAVTGAQCLTCHSGDDPGRLALERGGTVSLDHAYELCAQCHFTPVESWAKGAHGKRLVGWRGRRVVMGCADCHDPHDPSAKQRIPMAGLSLPGELQAGHGEAEGEGGSHE